MRIAPEAIRRLGSLVLGSRSATRRLLLGELGVPFTVTSAEIDEKKIRDSNASRLVLAIAHAKADAILPLLKSKGFVSNKRKNVAPEASVDKKSLLVCGDAVVLHKGNILEKPTSLDEARSFYRSYEEAPATTVASVVVVDVTTGKRFEGVSEAEVYFYPFSDGVIDELLKEEDVLESAGGLRIEHKVVEKHVQAIHGSKSGVMGFDKQLLAKLLTEALEE